MKNHNGDPLLRLIARTTPDGGIKLYQTTVWVGYHAITSGMIVELGGNYLRAYEDGQSGRLHFWNETTRVKAAQMERYQADYSATVDDVARGGW